MKIAILTWFSYGNYGTVLQAFALSLFLKKKGHTVDLVRYYPRRPALDASGNSTFKMILPKGVQKIKDILNKQVMNDRYEELFRDFVESNITFTANCSTYSDLVNLCNYYEGFVCGSDQIWSQECFDEHFYLDFVIDKRRTMAYAPSIGNTCFKNNIYREKITKLVSDIQYLSIREKSGKNILEECTGRKIPVVLDPTLLLSSNEWDEALNINNEDPKEQYALLFFLGNNRSFWKIACKLAENKRLNIKVIPTYFKDFRHNGVEGDVHPEQFVDLIKKATIVCTDSYHAILFSIIYNKQFYAFKRFKGSMTKGQNSRIFDLLSELKLPERMVLKNRIKDVSIDYKDANHILNVLITESKQYLTESINEMSGCSSELSLSVPKYIDGVCTGCAMCSYFCPTKAITVGMDEKGFYKAFVDENKCMRCNRCLSVCPWQGTNDASVLSSKSLFAYKDDISILNSSSSGGAAYRLSKILMEKGYSIIACKYDYTADRARHVLISDSNELERVTGSKYIQSSFDNVYSYIESTPTPIALFATPCQIAATKKAFTNRDNIIYIEIICHGIPTYNLFKKYLDYLKKKHYISGKTTSINFRDKSNGWKTKTLLIRSDNCSYKSKKHKDFFYQMYNSGLCYDKACYECRWRDRSNADLRIGDYWGKKYKSDTTGVSMLVPITEIGEKLVCELEYGKNKKLLIKQDIEDYYTSQQISNSPHPLNYEYIISSLANNEDNIALLSKKFAAPICKRNDFIDKIMRVYGKFKR